MISERVQGHVLLGMKNTLSLEVSANPLTSCTRCSGSSKGEESYFSNGTCKGIHLVQSIVFVKEIEAEVIV